VAAILARPRFKLRKEFNVSIIEKAASRIDRSARQRPGTATAGRRIAAPSRSPPCWSSPKPAQHETRAGAAAARRRCNARGRTRRAEIHAPAGRAGPGAHARAGHGHRRRRPYPLLEDFRIIKRPLLQRAFAERVAGDKPGNLIMVTSSLPGEGKTYCAINLAMSIAMELDHTVLLVDADVARPSVLRTLGLPAQRGLMDILVDDKLDMADVMLRTNVDTCRSCRPAPARRAPPNCWPAPP
jgi:protein-tyrosine kinase